jgi:hypothetical protein
MIVETGRWRFFQRACLHRGVIITARFTSRGTWKKRVPQLLQILVALGRVRETDRGYLTIN